MSLHDRVHHLFLLDQQLRGIRRRLDAALVRLTARQGKLDQFQRQRDEVVDQLKHAKAKVGTLEVDLNESEVRVNQLREQMNTVKNNKEYSALLQEVSSMKVEKSKIEDEALEQMAYVDRIKQQLEDLDVKIAEQQEVAAKAQADVEDCQAQHGRQIEELTMRHQEAEKQLPAEVQAVFKRLTEAHEGEALAEINEQNRRTMEYSCGGCYIGIPFERVNALMTHSDQIVCCPTCGRILYIDQELRSAIGCK